MTNQNFYTIKQASFVTGKSGITIRRLIKKIELSNPDSEDIQKDVRDKDKRGNPLFKYLVSKQRLIKEYGQLLNQELPEDMQTTTQEKEKSKQKLERSSQLISQLKKELAQKEEAITQKEKLITEKEEMIMQKEDLLNQKDSQVDEVKEEKTENVQLYSSKLIEILTGQIQQKDEQIKEMNKQMSNFSEERKADRHLLLHHVQRVEKLEQKLMLLETRTKPAEEEPVIEPIEESEETQPEEFDIPEKFYEKKDKPETSKETEVIETPETDETEIIEESSSQLAKEK